jgi:ADP-dependent NAD(P)H-hydrate dehydratase / NAD(P)H-hydrate epimerase
MIRILNTKQIRELDEYTIRQEGINSIDLMERACRAFVTWFVQRIDATEKIGIVCGTGNNGGDGLGIALMLKDWGYNVRAYVVRGEMQESNDFKLNFDRIKNTIQVSDIKDTCPIETFSGLDVIIDAIFGSGLSRPAENIYAKTIRSINEVSVIRIAVDIPSGLLADAPSSGDIIMAHHTVAFQLPKLSFFLPVSYAFTGEWTTVDIGLNKDFIKEASTNVFQVTQKDIKKILRPRSKFDHKGKFGHALLVAGSLGKIGAAVLSSRATLRSGAGLVTAHVPKCGYNIIQTTLPEAMVRVDPREDFISSIDDSQEFTTIGIGPGIGRAAETVNGIKELLKNFRKPVVIDADGLNILSENSDMIGLIPENSILSPHPKEFERLVGKWQDDFDKLEKQKKLASKIRSVVILKGAFTSIATQEGKLYFNTTGNPGMAKGGSGDVLTGILTGLLSQGYNATEASIAGVYWHGIAGDLAAVEKGTFSVLASDLVEFLPQAWKRITN